MLFFIDGHLDLSRLAPNEAQRLLQQEIDAVRWLKASGVFLAAVRTEALPPQPGAPRVLGMVRATSRQELEQVLRGLPLAAHFTWDQIVPVVEL